MTKAILYSTPSCTYCKVAKDFFNKNGVEYIEHNVAVDEEALNDMVSKSNQMGVPVIDIDGEIFVGFNQSQLAKTLKVVK